MSDPLEEQFTPEEQLSGDLANLAIGWQELGIDPDCFVQCSRCKGYFAEAAMPGDKVCRCPE